MLKSINDQQPATKNQITNEKPSVFKNANILQGYFGNSLNGGHIKTISYKYVMAGEKHLEERIRCNIKLQTPLTPAYQKLKATFKAYFVPNSRVWTNAEKFMAQKGGATVTKIKEIPNINKFKIPYTYSITISQSNKYKNYLNTDIFRDSWASSYLPRWFRNDEAETTPGSYAMPKVSALPFRGFKAIYNDYERNKEYDEELTEYKGDTVSQNEFDTYFMQAYEPAENIYKYIIRGKRQNSYYTDYRTELLGEDINEPTSGTGDLINITEWEKKVAEMRSEAENAQLNDWDIIAKIRGSKKLTEGKVQLLGQKTVGLNYQAITQSTYNTNSNVKPEFQTMGTQGAFSYTEIDIPIYQMQEFNEEGYIHILMQITADSVFECGVDRTNLNVGIMDIYRPDNKDLKHDVLYDIEKGRTQIHLGSGDVYVNPQSTGFKRKYSEYFKLPNVIQGDVTSDPIIETSWTKQTPTEQGYTSPNTMIQITLDGNGIPVKDETQHTFSFFEENDQYEEIIGTGRIFQSSLKHIAKKNIWQDYTDILLNKNQAIQNLTFLMNYQYVEGGQTNTVGNMDKPPFIRVKGQNQALILGMITTIAELPIDENIRKNYTTWGEK